MSTRKYHDSGAQKSNSSWPPKRLELFWWHTHTTDGQLYYGDNKNNWNSMHPTFLTISITMSANTSRWWWRLSQLSSAWCRQKTSRERNYNDCDRKADVQVPKNKWKCAGTEPQNLQSLQHITIIITNGHCSPSSLATWTRIKLIYIAVQQEITTTIFCQSERRLNTSVTSSCVAWLHSTAIFHSTSYRQSHSDSRWRRFYLASGITVQCQLFYCTGYNVSIYLLVYI